MFDRIQHRERLVEMHGERHSPSDRQRNLHLCTGQTRGKPALQTEQCEQIAFLDQRHRAPLHKTDRVICDARGDRMFDCLSPQLLPAIPLARAAMQFRHLVGVLCLELRPQVLAHQMVIAEPLPVAVERLQQQLALGDFVQHALARAQTRYRLAERRAQPVEYRRAQHELDHFGGQPLEHVFDIGGERPRRT